MRDFIAAMVVLGMALPTLAVSRSNTADSVAQKNAIAECAPNSAPKGTAKFTGRIQSAQGGNSVEVVTGNETAAVTVVSGAVICQGGQAVSAAALTPGALVTAYGEVRRNGKQYQVSATKIFVEGQPTQAVRMNPPPTGMDTAGVRMQTTMSSAPPTGNSQGTSTTARDDWQSSTGQPAGQTSGQSSGQSSGQAFGQSTGQSARGGSVGGKAATSISCDSLKFTIPGGAGATTGGAASRSLINGITCIRGVDEVSLQLTDDAMRNERMATITLTWQGLLIATLQNATISSVEFLADGSRPTTEVTFQFTRLELAHPGSGTRLQLDGRP